MAGMHELLPGLDEIYEAMDTNDMVKIVNASTNAMKKSNVFFEVIPISKSIKQSNEYLETGNEHYKAGRNKLAIICYNKSLAYAPKNSEEISLALGNRSAVFFNIRHFSACMKDIDSCLNEYAMKCKRDLVKILKKRKTAILHMQEETEDIFTKKKIDLSYFDLNFSRNVEVPCASEDVSFIQDGVKRITAGNDIKCGSLVAFERAYTTCLMNEASTYLSCYYCNKMALNLFPCEGCYGAMFCSVPCQEDCMKEYHRVECQIMDVLEPYYKTLNIKLVTRAIIKLSLKMRWDGFIAAAEDIGPSRFKTTSVRETYDSREPVSILSYNEVGDRVVEGKIFNASMISASVIYWLGKVGGYFPKKSSKCQSAKDAMARMMMRLLVTFNHKVPILCSAYDFNSKTYKYGAQTNYGWFSMTSKLKHSCEPNLMVVGLNDSVGLVALRTIKAGEELTISFMGYVYDCKDSAPGSLRSNTLYVTARIMCNCRVCSDNIDTNANVNTTDKEKKLMAKLERFRFRAICEALDCFPFFTNQHCTAYNAMKKAMFMAQVKYTANTCLYQ